MSQGQSTIDAWNARFPDIELNLTVDVSKYHDSRVNRQFQRTGSAGADIAVLQTAHDYTRWKKDGRLYPYKPAHWEDIWSDIKDPDGAFLPTSISKQELPVYRIPRLLITIYDRQFRQSCLQSQISQENQRTVYLEGIHSPRVEEQARSNLPQRR